MFITINHQDNPSFTWTLGLAMSHMNTNKNISFIKMQEDMFIHVNTCRHDFKLKSLQETITNPINHKLLEHQNKNTYSENRASKPQISPKIARNTCWNLKRWKKNPTCYMIVKLKNHQGWAVAIHVILVSFEGLNMCLNEASSKEWRFGGILVEFFVKNLRENDEEKRKRGLRLFGGVWGWC